MQKERDPSSGISLIEMAIVLIIIALLTGGILKGRSLIAQSVLRKAATQMTDMQTALDMYATTYQETLSDQNDFGKKVWEALHKIHLIPKPDSIGYPRHALGGHFFIMRKQNPPGLFMVVGGLKEGKVVPVLNGEQVAFLRKMLGYEEGDVHFVVEGKGCAKKKPDQKSKCLVLLFLCE